MLALVFWLDGWRRRPDDAVFLVRLPGGPWHVRTPWAKVGPFALVAWWSPIVLPLLVSAPATHTDEPRRWAADFGIAVARGRRRLRRVNVGLTALRLVGALLLVWIAFGIPLITSRFGIAGLVRGIVSAVIFGAALAAVAIMELRTLDLRWWPAIRRAAPLLSPFSAPQAAEVLTTAALADIGVMERVAVLLGDTRFFTWIRPAAYDVLHDHVTTASGDTWAPDILVRALPRTVLERALGTRPDALDSDLAYCPRCAGTYREGMTTCTECGDLALVTPARSTGG